VFKKSGPLIVFCFPGQGFSLLGAGLSGGAALRWLRDVSLQATQLLSSGRITKAVYERFSQAAETVPPGSEGLLFIPYLSGARHKPSSTASFQGLQAHHTFAHMARAVMEGVVWELQSYARHFPQRSRRSTGLVIAGGGMSSRVWSTIAASVFGGPAKRGACQEQASLGAALIAAVGAGAYRDIAAAAAQAPMEAEVIAPEHRKEYAKIAETLPWEEF
jgi:xylulokinase